MSVAPKQVEGHWAYETAYSSFSLASFLAYTLAGPLFIRGDWSLAVCVLDAARSIAHFFLTFSLAAARLALATAF
jgi:hypothetical protein